MLSHPPYHKCIIYSHLDGDLSGHADLAGFTAQMHLVASESRCGGGCRWRAGRAWRAWPHISAAGCRVRAAPVWHRRLLRPGARCLVGIADNREHCFIVPVAFTVIATYLAEGFILEELVP